MTEFKMHVTQLDCLTTACTLTRIVCVLFVGGGGSRQSITASAQPCFMHLQSFAKCPFPTGFCLPIQCWQFCFCPILNRYVCLANFMRHSRQLPLEVGPHRKIIKWVNPRSGSSFVKLFLPRLPSRNLLVFVMHIPLAKSALTFIQ